MSVSSYNKIGHEYLQSRPHVYNGGLLAQILSNFVVSDSSTNLTLTMSSNLNIGNYISQFFLNYTTQVPSFSNSTVSYTTVSSNNLLTSIFGLFYLTIAFLTCCLAGILWTCWRISDCDPLDQICSKRLEYPDLSFLSNKETTEKRKSVLNYLIIRCIICYGLLLSFVICCTFSVMSQINLQQQLVGSSVNTSFLSSWQQSSSQLNTFINLMTVNSYSLFNQTVKNMSIALNNVLFGSLSNLTSDLLQTFGVMAVFNSANTLVTSLENTIQAMSYILANTNSTISNINVLTGSIQATVSLLRYSISQVCSVNQTCLLYLNTSDQFRVTINTDKISASSSIAMLYLLGQFQLNITSLSIQLSTMQRNFNNQLIAQTNTQINSLNLYQTVSALSLVWPFISQTISPWNQGFKSLSSTITDFLNIYGYSIFITTAVLLVMIIVLALLYVMVLIRYTVLYLLQRRNFNRISIKTMKIIEKIEWNYGISNPVIYSYVIVISFIVFVILILALVILNVSHFFYNEACIQIWSQDGLTVSDRFLDIFINNYWSSIISFIVTQNLPIQFIFPQPTKILNGIRNYCTNDNGIFYALNMSNFVNISSFLWSPQNYQSLVGGLNITYSTLMSINVATMIPQTMTDFLTVGASISSYFDQINYQPTIDELSKGVIELQNYSNWLDSAIQYFSTINGTDALHSVRLLKSLKTSVPNVMNIEVTAVNLGKNFQILQNSRRNTLNIQTLLSNIQNVQTMLVGSPSVYKTVETLYNQRMMREFPANAVASLSSLLANLINHLFPCATLSLAVTILLDNLCSADATIEKMASYGLNISLTCAFLMMMLHVLWSIVRTDLEEKKEENVSFG